MSTTAASLPPSEQTTFSGRATSIEWPTVALGGVILGLYLALTLNHRHVPTAILIVLLGVISGWWSSFQHELIHGHPFRSNRANELFGSFAMDLWIPFRVYKGLHLRHHQGASLTDPFDDPESFYRDSTQWNRANRLVRGVWWCNRTFVGRMVIGPPTAFVGFFRNEFRRLLRNESSARREWAVHAPWFAIAAFWAFGIARVPVWQYVVGTVWVGTAVIQIRSFAEHVWRPDNDDRTAFVDGYFPFGLLFLFNNMHNAHHARPSVPWYQLPRLAKHLGSRADAATGAGYYRGYRDVIKRYAFTPFSVPVYPPSDDGVALDAARLPQTTGAVLPGS
jgi:fatty acid desaturase